jgi:hypothetical protein
MANNWKARASHTAYADRQNKSRATSVYHGARQGLFAPAVVAQTDGLNAISREMEVRIAQALYALGRAARDMARAAAPVRTGALRAGIYVTAPASRPDLDRIAGGEKVGLSQLKGHTRGYYSAISAAAKRRGLEVPDDESFITPRTQRLRAGIDKAKFEKIMGAGVEEDRLQQTLNLDLPFNPIGSAGRTAFYVGIGSAMYYSAWVEYGTAFRRAKPFFTPAARWLEKEAAKAITKTLRDMKAPAGTRRALLG